MWRAQAPELCVTTFRAENPARIDFIRGVQIYYWRLLQAL